ncbi:MAG: hypothetical protein C4292_02800 [Nitrososphaera sp.]
MIEGFGAGHISLVYKGLGDILGPDLRARAIEAAYNQVKLTTGYIDHVVLESPGGYDQRRNDDDDPFHINGNGFNHNAVDDFKQKVLDLARPKGFDNFFLAQRVNVRWASPWLDDIRSRDYNRYLDECAEQVLAGLLYWRNTYGITPRYNLLFNEPTSGNGELLNGNVKDVIDIIKRAGARLRKEGFPDVKFVIPNEETEEHSLAVAAAVLADPEARQYVGAIGYHPYPYGSPYVSVPRILSSAGAGRPDVGRVELRQKLRDLGRLLPSMSPFKINVILRYLQRLEAIVVDNDGYITWVRDKEGSGQQLTLGDVATMSDELKEFLKKSNAEEEGEDEEKEEEE